MATEEGGTGRGRVLGDAPQARDAAGQAGEKRLLFHASPTLPILLWIPTSPNYVVIWPPLDATRPGWAGGAHRKAADRTRERIAPVLFNELATEKLPEVVLPHGASHALVSQSLANPLGASGLQL